MAAPTTVDYATAPLAGFNFSTTYAPVDTSNPYTLASTPAPVAVGQAAMGTDNTEYVFVLAGEAIVQYAAVAISEAGTATVLTLAKAQQLSPYGFAQVAIPNGYYGWVARRGQNLGVLARSGSLANVACYISNVSAGRITTTSVRSTSGGTLVNLVLTTSGTASPSGATVAKASWPGYTS